MPSYVSVRSRSGSRDGVALILVLACIVLLSILILSMISFTRLGRLSTASYSRSIQAQEIAQGGIQDILGDLHTEIVAGSVTPAATYINGSGSFARAYIPTNNFAAAPAHIGYDPTAWAEDINGVSGAYPDGLAPTLLRVSRASQDPTDTTGIRFYPNIATNSYFDPTLIKNLINRASASNSSTPSANGRAITWARWNKTFLIGCSSTTNEADSPYCMPGAFCFTNYPAAYAAQGNVNAAIKPPYGPPDWVYVTRSGSRVCTNTATELPLLKPNSSVTTSYTVTPGQNPPASPIIGRYAYVVYDEGATLDVNAAGFYSSTPSVQAYSMTNSANFYTASNTPISGVNTIQSVTGKSYLPYADLSITSLLESQANVNKFITWRNGSISSPSSNFQMAAFNYSLNNFLTYNAGDNPLLSRQDLINYFAQVDGPTAFNADTASPGQSRALPYLGTFSRAVSAPSWTPEFNASVFGGNNGGSPGIYSYHDNAETGTTTPFSGTSPNPNRDLANVRFASAGSIIHYYDSTSTGTYTVSVGDPLVQSRFSLAKIAWLSEVNPNMGVSATLPSAYATPIQSCFGLTWGTVGAANGGNPCWSYVGGAGLTPTAVAFNGTIETLDQVAKEGREPNFFELLKAAILNGSVGMSPGPAGFENVTLPIPTSTGRGNGYGVLAQEGSGDAYSYSFDRVAYAWGTKPAAPSPNGIGDMQIMQIGVNIIDQYGSSSYPTAIYFNYQIPGTINQLSSTAYDASGALNQIFGRSDMVYGDKNLPYLMGFVNLCATTDGLPTTTYDPTTPHPLAYWWQPEVWNPHQMPNATNGGASPPQKFQINGYGQLDFWWNDEMWSGNNQGGPTQGPPWVATLPSPPGSIPFATSNGQTLANTVTGAPIQYITFTDTSPTTSGFYAQPIMLGKFGTAANAQGANITATASDIADMTAQPAMYHYSDNPFVGFWAGTQTTGFYGCLANLDQNGIKTVAQISSTAATFCLGWVDSTGGFHPYSYLPGNFLDAPYGTIYNKAVGQPSGGCWPSDNDTSDYVLMDPRTPRFGENLDWQIGNMSMATYPLGISTWFPDNATGSRNTGSGLPATPRFSYWLSATYDCASLGDWEVNMPTPLAQTGAPNSEGGGAPSEETVNSSGAEVAGVGRGNYYWDADGVTRPGDGVFGASATGDGTLLFCGTKGSGTGGVASGDANNPSGVTNGTGNTYHGRRPIVLNRPFRNVGELGYTYRDLPFKTLDFFSQYSADAALLDVFSTTDESQVTSANTLNSVVAGKVDINNAPVSVLNALLNYGSKKDFDASYDMLKSGANSDSSTIATAIANQLAIPAWNSGSGTGPMASRADLVTLLGANPTTGSGAIRLGFSLSHLYDRDNKAYLEAPVRALSNLTNARTWNLMIDIIAQSGELTPTATSLDNFVVQGEKRYWLHIAIDRYTGKIVDQQLEQVYE